MNLTRHAALTCLALAACRSSSHRPDGHDSMMPNLSGAQREPIDDALAGLVRRTDALAVARQAIVRTKVERDLARTYFGLAEANVPQSEADVTFAKTGCTVDPTAATTTRSVALRGSCSRTRAGASAGTRVGAHEWMSRAWIPTRHEGGR